MLIHFLVGIASTLDRVFKYHACFLSVAHKTSTMKSTNKMLLLSTALSGLILSCNKSDSGNNPTTPDAIVATWKPVAEVSDTPVTKLGFQTTDIWVHLPDCLKDNLWIFRSDASLEINAGANTCNGADVTMNGTWRKSNDTLYTMQGGTPGITAKILQLDATTLKIYLPERNINGADTTNYMATITMTKQ